MLEVRFYHGVVRLEGDLDPFLEGLAFVFGPMLRGPVSGMGNNGGMAGCIWVKEMPDGRVILRGAREKVYPDPQEAFVALVNSINALILTREGEFLTLHAGAVAGSSLEAVIIPGHSESGKSTLSLYFADKGLELLTDEGIFFHPHRGRFLPYPRAASRFPGGFASRSGRFEELRIGHLVSYFRPRGGDPSRLLGFYRVKGVLLLRRGEYARLERIDHRMAVQELAPHVLGAPPARRIRALLELVSRPRFFYRLTWRSMEDLFDAGDRFLEEVFCPCTA